MVAPAAPGALLCETLLQPESARTASNTKTVERTRPLPNNRSNKFDRYMPWGSLVHCISHSQEFQLLDVAGAGLKFFKFVLVM